MTHEEAAILVREVLKIMNRGMDVLDSKEIGVEGWVFYYNSAEYVRTLDDAFFVWGSNPIFVRSDGATYWLDSISKVEALQNADFNTV